MPFDLTRHLPKPGTRFALPQLHGSADAYGFEWAIKRGYDAVKNGVLERLVRAMEENAAPLAQAARDVGGAGHANLAGRPGEPYAAVSSKA